MLGLLPGVFLTLLMPLREAQAQPGQFPGQQPGQLPGQLPGQTATATAVLNQAGVTRAVGFRDQSLNPTWIS